MTHEPGAGRSQYTQRRGPPSCAPAQHIKRTCQRHPWGRVVGSALFLALCVNAPFKPQSAPGAADIFACSGVARRDLTHVSLNAPGSSRLELPAHLEPSSAWHEIRVELRRMVGESTYEIWLAPLEVKAMDGAQLLLEAPPATQAWVAKRFGRILETCARAVVGP